HVKIADLGIARQLASSSDSADTAIGTPNYMSPEVVRGEPYAWPSDYEMASGRYAFEAAAMADLVRKITAEDPPPLPK
ncbi:Serine/threonine-protein kinase Nek4, partial [Cladochytrium tenue]